MFIKGENEKGDAGASPNFQSSFDEFLKEGINATFKGGEEDYPVYSTG
jgi:hypothetical protein